MNATAEDYWRVRRETMDEFGLTQYDRNTYGR